MTEYQKILIDLKFWLILFVLLFAAYAGAMIVATNLILNELEKANEQTQTTHITRRS